MKITALQRVRIAQRQAQKALHRALTLLSHEEQTITDAVDDYFTDRLYLLTADCGEGH